jgi:4-oxalocrotonate tautomerase
MPAQKSELIKGASALLVRVLNKAPAMTFVVIGEVGTDNGAVAGQSVTSLRLQKN